MALNTNTPHNRSWYHGSEGRLTKWLPCFRTALPERLLLSEKAFFLYDTPSAAAINGSVITRVNIKQDISILDVADDSPLSERLRLEVASNHLLKLSDNSNKEFWHTGWKTGAMLRLSVTDPGFEHKIYQQISRQAEESDKPFQKVYDEFLLELSHEMVGHILSTAARMGYDGLTGYAPVKNGVNKPARFLAIFSPKMMTAGKWVTFAA